MADRKLTMKLLIDTKSQKVVFAEAGKDVVDFLFSLLGMPVGSIVKLLSKDRMVGSIPNLYNSLEGLDMAYLQPNCDKTELLNPVVPSPEFTHNTTMFLKLGPITEKKYYRCAPNSGGNKINCSHVTDIWGLLCPSCYRSMTTEMSYVAPKTDVMKANAAGWVKGGAGLVKGVVTYTIMDDLTVTPMSTISGITLLNKLQVKEVSALKEKSVKLGFEKGLELLQAALQCQAVLTHVFLGKK